MWSRALCWPRPSLCTQAVAQLRKNHSSDGQKRLHTIDGEEWQFQVERQVEASLEAPQTNKLPMCCLMCYGCRFQCPWSSLYSIWQLPSPLRRLLALIKNKPRRKRHVRCFVAPHRVPAHGMKTFRLCCEFDCSAGVEQKTSTTPMSRCLNGNQPPFYLHASVGSWTAPLAMLSCA